jgi:CheY-like chemotaxis protein
MAKVLLVEDDNNLREIFQMRLQAEGYSTLVASDGEEGLVVAMKEKPDLLIADIMMPKLSGFEMVENLRSAPETKDIKVIMMTALGQAEDQARGEKLGVVKYLVKSQVTLEDFARVVKEVLGPGDPQAATSQIANSPINTQGSESNMPEDTTPTNPPMPGGDTPASDPTAPATPPATPAMPSTDGQQSTAEEQGTVQNQIDQFSGSAPASSDPAAPASDSGTSSTDTGAPTMPPSSEPPAAPTEPPASTDAPTDPTSNAL